MKISGFFEHGKDTHRDFEKGALNDSSRSLIWSFLEQIEFLKNCEKVSKLSKLTLGDTIVNTFNRAIQLAIQ